ncbi:MAG: branched-chain amino acid ABC transporter substrate-binding protein, partial [Spirochaeta sp.]|nr:branched-chain amino acid ABC transporter substrate-binding protein [Spirochaeta sp.]
MKRKISRKLLFALLVLAGVALVFAGCAGDEQEIAIGVAGAHSGDLASYGLPSVNAAELVVDQYNENGGVM